VLAVLLLLAIAMLVACKSTYSASNDGLVIVPNLGSASVQAFSLNLTNGRTTTINTAPPILGQATAMVLNPNGNIAYVTVVPNPLVFQTLTASSIAAYSVNSDGSLTPIGTPLTMGTLPGGVVNPVAMTIDSAGQFIFVADQIATDALGNAVPGTISVFSVGAAGALSEVAGSPFQVPVLQTGPVTTANLVGLAVTPTKYPALNTQAVANAECSLVQQLPPSTPEYLYVADANNNLVWGFNVLSTGALQPIVYNSGIVTFAAYSVTTGVAVDPCNRFVYVTNNMSNNVSAYAICNTSSPARPPICDTNNYPQGYLVTVPSSPFYLGGAPGGPSGPTVLQVDPLANYLYVVDKQSNQLSCFRISEVNGGLAPLSTATVNTGINPTAIAIRADDNWVFVANNDTVNGFGVISQYELTPATGILTPYGDGIQTDNYPTAVVVK